MSASESVRPVVGLTTYLQRSQTGVWDVNASFLPGVYIDGVTLAGATAVLLPPQPLAGGVADRVVSGLDGLVLTGGRDVDPARYGQQRLETTEEPRADRDDWEFALLAAALRQRLPILGICRGAQVLNVGRGGTLHQDLPAVVGHSDHRIGNAQFAVSTVTTQVGSRIADLVGPTVDVHCYHHQAIDELGRSLIATARDTIDAVVEAVEWDRSDGDDRFVVAVQWHPEENLTDLRLFDGIVAAARTYAAERAA